jgi:hypothetical protein
MKVAGGAVMKKAKVALARKIAVIMHRMLADERACCAHCTAAEAASMALGDGCRASQAFFLGVLKVMACNDDGSAASG